GCFDYRAAVEEDELHPQRFRNRAGEHGFAAALRAVEQDVQAALEQDLELPRNDRVEPDAFQLEVERADKLDLDRAAVRAGGLADGGDLHHAGDAGTD